LRILVVAGYFPPYAPASASRVNKFVKYLDARGHDVRVLGPKNPDFPPTLQPEISPDKIIYSGYSRINDLPGRVKTVLKNTFSRSKDTAAVRDEKEKKEQGANSGAQLSHRPESRLSRAYRMLTNIPDSLIGWYPHAVRAGRALFRHWSPDIIFATTPPHTTLLVASRLARLVDVPWVVDYRDLWADHGYYDAPWFRAKIDRFLENCALANCRGIVTVTRTWTDLLRQKRSQPVICVMNGYDPDDFAGLDRTPQEMNRLTLLYAGILYGRKRDPMPLFEALGRLGPEADKIRVLFYTPNGRADLDEEQEAVIRKYGLDDKLKFHPYIPQKELLAVQARMDVLLLLRWDNPREEGVIAGKLFEYIGADKPILSVGLETGEAADIIRDNGFGFVSRDPDAIAGYLKERLAAKMAGERSALDPDRRAGYDRNAQFAKLEKFLFRVAGKGDRHDSSQPESHF
tara:strand:- start:3533 stop:4906 length:1374 start_codon:yes stop_codon:yes gene_type:complete